MPRRMTHEDFCRKLEERHPGVYDVIGVYERSDIKIKLRHLECGDVIDITPNSAITKAPCRTCGIKGISESKKKTHGEFVDEIRKMNPHIEIVSKYQGVDKRVSVIYLECGHESTEYPQSLRARPKCGKCSVISRRANPSDFRKAFEDVYDNEYELLTDYVRSSEKVMVRHVKCGREYLMSPGKIRAGQRCRVCADKKNGILRRSNTKRFARRLLNKRGEDFEIVGEYITKYAPIKVRHKKCGEVYETYPALLIAGGACPNCVKYESKGEIEVMKELENLGIDYVREKRVGGILRVDFYLPKHRAYIEYDGIQHYIPVEYFGGVEAFEEASKRDAIKDHYCRFLGFPLLRIPYWEFDNIPQIVTEFIEELEEERKKRKEDDLLDGE